MTWLRDINLFDPAADPDPFCPTPAQLEYVIGWALWHKSRKRVGQWSNMTSTEFVDRYVQRFGSEPSFEGVSNFGALAALCNAIEIAGTLEQTAVARALRQNHLQEFYADFAYDENGMIAPIPLTLQVLGNASFPTRVQNLEQRVSSNAATVVFPPAEALGDRLQFPMPTWEVRRCFQTCTQLRRQCNLETGACECVDGYSEDGLGNCSFYFGNLLEALSISATAAFISIGILLLLAMVAYACFKDRGRHLIRLRSTGKPPDLTLFPGHSFHLFLSHTWATGQNQAHQIKASCLYMLPHAQIFLDVDDLDSIDDLESYVESSACVLLFVSRGYFASRNCKREYECALLASKPLVLIHEPQRNHGGGPLTELQQECPEPLRSPIFDGRTSVEYLRLSQFQKAAILHICTQLVLATPKYAPTSVATSPNTTRRRLSISPRIRSPSIDHAPVELYTQASILAKPLALSRRIVLFVSPLNPGALEVAQCMQAKLGVDKVVVRTDVSACYEGRTTGQRNRQRRRSSFGAVMGAITEPPPKTQMSGNITPSAEVMIETEEQGEAHRMSATVAAQARARTGQRSNAGPGNELTNVARQLSLTDMVSAVENTAQGAMNVAAKSAAEAAAVSATEVMDAASATESAVMASTLAAEAATEAVVEIAHAADSTARSLSELRKSCGGKPIFLLLLNEHTFRDEVEGATDEPAVTRDGARSSKLNDILTLKRQASSWRSLIEAKKLRQAKEATDRAARTPTSTLAGELREIMKLGMPVALFHSWEVPFETFFERTPQDLLVQGIFRDLAIPQLTGPLEAVSLAMLASKLGAEPHRTMTTRLLLKTKKVASQCLGSLWRTQSRNDAVNQA